MPPDQDDELQQIREKSPFWGLVWIVGDIAYYLGLVGALVIPMCAAWMVYQPIDSLLKVLKCVGLFVVLLVPGAIICIPTGFAVTILFKGLASRFTGVRRSGDSTDT